MKRNVQYNIPRVVVESSARFQQLGNDPLLFVPGTTQPVTFLITNKDGKNIHLGDKKLVFLAWKPHSASYLHSQDANNPSMIVLKKEMVVENPHSVEQTMVFDADETRIICKESLGSPLSWSIALVDTVTEEVYPLNVSSKGYYGTIAVSRGFPDPMTFL